MSESSPWVRGARYKKTKNKNYCKIKKILINYISQLLKKQYILAILYFLLLKQNSIPKFCWNNIKLGKKSSFSYR